MEYRSLILFLILFGGVLRAGGATSTKCLESDSRLAWAVTEQKAEDPTDTFLRLIQDLVGRSRMSAKEISGLAEREEPVNPVFLAEGLTSAERHANGKAFDELLKTAKVDWNRVRRELAEGAEVAQEREQKRQKVQEKTETLEYPVLRKDLGGDKLLFDNESPFFILGGIPYTVISHSAGVFLINLNIGTQEKVGEATDLKDVGYFEYGGTPYVLGRYFGKVVFIDLKQRKESDPLFDPHFTEHEFQVLSVAGRPHLLYLGRRTASTTEKTRVFLQPMAFQEPTKFVWDKYVHTVTQSDIQGTPTLHGINQDGILFLTSLLPGKGTQTMSIGTGLENPGRASQAYYETPQGPRLLCPHRDGAVIVDPVGLKVVDKLDFRNDAENPVRVVKTQDRILGLAAGRLSEYVEVFDLVTNKSIQKIPANPRDCAWEIFVHNGKAYVAIGDSQGVVHLFDALTAKEYGQLDLGVKSNVDVIQPYSGEKSTDAVVKVHDHLFKVQLVGPVSPGGKKP